MKRLFVAIVSVAFFVCLAVAQETDFKSDVLRQMKGIEVDRPTTRSAKGTRVYNSAAKSVVYIETDTGSGSGVLVSKDGLVVTNWHVVEDAKQYIAILIMPEAGRSYTVDDIYLATVTKTLPSKDLALLKMTDPPPNLVAATLGKLTSLQVAADVHAIGHPQELYWSYTPGVISQVRNWDNGGIQATVIQTQAVISHGSSGGALFDDTGLLIGLTTFQLEKGLNFAIAANEISALLR